MLLRLMQVECRNLSHLRLRVRRYGMKRLIVILLMVGVSAPAFAGDLRKSINAAATDSAVGDTTAGESAAAATQQAQAPKPAFNRREPVLALVLSLVFPGIGQLYNGPTEQHKGFIFMGIGAGALAITMIGASRTCSVSDILSSGGCSTSPLLYLGYLGYVGDEVYSAYDGYSRAGELNKEHGLALNVRPEVVAGRTGVRAAALYHIKW
jgi:hypothetical protein